MGAAGTVVIGGIDAHSAARDAVFSEGYTCRHALFGKGAVLVIAIKFIRLGIVGDKNIGPAVAVVVEHGHAQRFAGSLADTGLLSDVFKFTAAGIVVQLRLRAFIGFRRAI